MELLFSIISIANGAKTIALSIQSFWKAFEHEGVEYLFLRPSMTYSTNFLTSYEAFSPLNC